MSAGLSLRLIATSDLHANVFPYDYCRDRRDDTVGLAKTASLIAAARAEVANTLLFDNGDIIQGSPLGDYAAAAMGLRRGDIHPMIAAMNTLGYAACSIGNHDFNYGLDCLEIALAGANFPALSCNILRPDGAFYFKPWLILEPTLRDEAGAERRLRVGVIGFTPPQIVQWDLAHLKGRATTIGIVEAARIHLPALRAQGVDLIVALCHSGISRKPPPQPGEENAALALAALGGIDAMILGHQHLTLPGEDFAGLEGVDAINGALCGVPACMPGFWGSHLGVIDLALAPAASGWRVASSRVEARPISRRNGERVVALAQADRHVLAAAEGAHEATLAYVRKPVGQIDAPLNSFFALVANDPSVQIVNAAQTWYVERLAASLPALAGPPILSAASPFKAGGRGGPDYYTDVAAGPIAIKDIADLYLFPNALRVVKIDGATLAEWLERSAGVFQRLDPDAAGEQPLINSAVAAYNFDVVAGVTYTIDVTQPSRYDDDGELVAPNGRRIQSLAFRGAPVDPRQVFLVVTNSYRAGGGGHFPGCDSSTVVFEAPDSNRDAVMRYIAETRHIEPKSDASWRFAPWPTSIVATYLTSPAAANAAPPTSVRLTPMGAAPGGFAKYRVEVA